jgi:hypothetical protein
MITTNVLNEIPLIIHHKIDGFGNEKETTTGVRDAIRIIENALDGRESFNLLMDFTELGSESQYNMSAHRIWAQGFKDNNLIRQYVRNTAVVANDSPKYRAEKEFMEDETHRWFTSFEYAYSWLKEN